MTAGWLCDDIGASLRYLDEVRGRLGLPPLAPGEEWLARCADCGVVLGDRRSMRYVLRDCADCRRVARETRADATRMAARESIPAHFRWAVGSSPLLAQRTDAGEAWAILEHVRGLGAAVVLAHGPAGSGKTSAACAALAEWVATHPGGPSARYMTARELGRADRDARLGSEPPVLGVARNASLLVVDELGSEPFGREAIRDLVIARHADERPTIMCSWKSPANVAETYGDGLGRRVSRFARFGGAA